MILSERIDAIIKHSGLSIPKFAKNVGFTTPQTIRELINGRTKSLSYAVTNKILAAYPEINETWLKTGEGEMLTSPSKVSLIDHSSDRSGDNIGQIDNHGEIRKAGRDYYEEPCREDKVMIDTLRKEVEHLTTLLAEREKRVQRLENDIDKRDAQIDKLMALLERK